MAEIEIKNARKVYHDGTEALDDVSLTIADGEFFILVGPSGCGKSTLLNLIIGLEDITEGTLTVDGDVMNDVDPKDRDMAMVFQNYAIYPHMTVRENIAFPLQLARKDEDTIKERVESVAASLDITPLLDKRPANLSGGQRQRVAMGRAIVREPKVFLMDEPLSNLDAKLRVQMRTEIAGIQHRLKVTTVYVTHDQTEAMTLGDRVAVLRKGRLQQVAPPRELYRQPVNLFVAGFIGSPAMNFLPGDVKDGVVKITDNVSLPLPSSVSEADLPKNVIVGLRPEAFEDAELVDHETREHGAELEVDVDVVEWLGSEVFVHFAMSSVAEQLDDLAEDLELTRSGEGRTDVVARIDPASGIKEGETARLFVDSRLMHLFDPETGETLSLRTHDDEVSPR